MDIENLCLGCMSHIARPDLPCPHCGWLPTMGNAFNLLPTGYLLSNDSGNAQYIIGKQIGRGGFGVTYLAWDIHKSQKVAVKEYFPMGIADRQRGSTTVIPATAKIADDFKNGVASFLKEAHKMLTLGKDPNIVEVKNFFQANNTAYIIMEYIDGDTFEKILADNGGRLTLDEVLKKLTPIISTLKRLHENKSDPSGRIIRNTLIHRDISPDNIMFTKSSTAKLLDFGAACISSSLSEDFILVKMGYTPPEQFHKNLGENAQGAWTDVYALAATIYRAITGEIPLDALLRQNNDNLKLPSTFGITIAQFQEKALLKGLALDYHQRYQTVEEFISDLSGKNPSESDNKIAISISLSSMGLIMIILFVIVTFFEIEQEYGLSELDREDWIEIITSANFLKFTIFNLTPIFCLSVYILELLRLYKRKPPKWLVSNARLNFTFLAQLIYSAVYLFFVFTTEMELETVIKFFVYGYALSCAISSTMGLWIGRQLLKKSN